MANLISNNKNALKDNWSIQSNWSWIILKKLNCSTTAKGFQCHMCKEIRKYKFFFDTNVWPVCSQRALDWWCISRRCHKSWRHIKNLPQKDWVLCKYSNAFEGGSFLRKARRDKVNILINCSSRENVTK